MASVNDISIRQLVYAVAVADTLGFHRAAEKCHVSQPTLSAQIAQLESVLEVQLFERDRRRVLVTPIGAELVARARKILLDVSDLLATAARDRDPLNGTIRVGVIPTVAPYLLPEVTPAITAAYPSLRLAFREEKTEDVLDELRSGNLDAGLIAWVPELDELAWAKVVDDPFVVAMPPGHRLAKKKTVDLADLDDERVLLLDEGHCFRTQALALCAKVGAREADLRATSLSTLVQMVASGAGLTLLPSMAVAVENRRAQIETRGLAGKLPSRMIALVFRPGSPMTSSLRVLARTIAEAASRGSHAPRAGHTSHPRAKKRSGGTRAI